VRPANDLSAIFSNHNTESPQNNGNSNGEIKLNYIILRVVHNYIASCSVIYVYAINRNKLCIKFIRESQVPREYMRIDISTVKPT
jgi:hypothetical protein